MSEFRILDYNYIFEDDVVITESSEDSEFPSTNLQNHIRAKPWRSSGNFVITAATNDALDFNDGGGEENATIDAGTYTGATLATEIEAKMDALTTDDITVSYSSSTGKFTIASDGGTLSLLWNTGTNTSTTVGSDIGFAVGADDTGAVTYTSDNIALHTEEWVKFDLDAFTDGTVDSAVIVFDPMVGSKLSAGAVVKLQANAADSWSSPSVNQTLTLDSDYTVYTHFFSSAQDYRYWRLHIVDPANTNLYVEIPKIILANATQFTYAPEIGFAHSMVDQSKHYKNAYGHTYSDAYPDRRSMDFSYKLMSHTDLETFWTIFKRVGNTVPIVVAADPTATMFDKDRFVLYGRVNGNFKAKQAFTTSFDTSLSIVEAM